MSNVPVRRTSIPSFGLQVAFHCLFIPALLLLWEGLLRVGLLRPIIVGRPMAMLEQLWLLLTSMSTLTAVQVTMTAVVAGLGLGAAAGVIAGLGLARVPALRRGLDPLFLAFYTLPRVALIPLFIAWFGLGLGSKIAAVFIHGFVVFLLATYTMLDTVDRALLCNFKMLCASRWQYVREIYLPWSATHFFVAFRQSLGLAIGTAVVAELIGSFQGVGYEIGLRLGAFDMNGTLAWVLVIATIAVALDRLATFIEARLLVWR